MAQKPPSKPEPTSASSEALVKHYNSQVPAYNEAISQLDEKKRPDTGKQEILNPNARLREDLGLTREDLIDLIRRQNHRLGRHIKNRSHELLLHHRLNDDGTKLLKEDKYSTGYSYQEILDILAKEFPEASTSAACLRWYVVKMREYANEQGLEWPDLPQFRPRSAKPKKEGG